MAEKTNTYKHRDSGITQGAYEGSPLDLTLAADEDWEPAGRGAKRGKEEPTDPAPKTDKDVDEQTDLSTLNRAQLDQAAAQRGVEDPEKLPSKKAVLEAIDQVSNQNPEGS